MWSKKLVVILQNKCQCAPMVGVKKNLKDLTDGNVHQKSRPAPSAPAAVPNPLQSTGRDSRARSLFISTIDSLVCFKRATAESLCTLRYEGRIYTLLEGKSLQTRLLVIAGLAAAYRCTGQQGRTITFLRASNPVFLGTAAVCARPNSQFDSSAALALQHCTLERGMSARSTES